VFVRRRGLPREPRRAAHTSAVPDLRIGWNFPAETVRVIAIRTSARAVFLSVLGNSVLVLRRALPRPAAGARRGRHPRDAAVVTCCSSSSRWASASARSSVSACRSARRARLVPFGSIGMTLFALDLFIATQWHNTLARRARFSRGVERASEWRWLFDLAMIGMFGGFYSVPLNAISSIAVTREALPHHRGEQHPQCALHGRRPGRCSGFCASVRFTSRLRRLPAGSYRNALVRSKSTRCCRIPSCGFSVWMLMPHRLPACASCTEERIPTRGGTAPRNHVSFVDAFCSLPPRVARFAS